jgi:hypothetical protein
MENKHNKHSDKNIISVNTSDVEPSNNLDRKCAPGILFESGSCIKLHILIEMATAYNNSVPEGKIKLYSDIETLNPKKYKKYLLKEIKNKTGDKCTSQFCWTQQKFIDQMNISVQLELKKFTFRPNGPQGKFEWLNTFNIDDSMSQTEAIHKDFKYLGTVPMDFNDFTRYGIKDINYSKLVDEGKTKIGVVFNLDDHDQPGSHWVSMYSDLIKGGVYYFDSYGLRPEKRVRNLMRKISGFCKNDLKIKNVVATHNKIRHQYKNSECGVYSMNFIKRMLRGDDFQQICKSKTSDEKINKCRNVYFRNNV